MPPASSKKWDNVLEAILARHVTSDDASHDIAHFRRVLANARKIAACEASRIKTMKAHETYGNSDEDSHPQARSFSPAGTIPADDDTYPDGLNQNGSIQDELNLDVLTAACYFHDVVSLPKNHPERARSSVLAGEKAVELLQHYCPDFPSTLHDRVRHAIEAHSFSANIIPRTLEARIMQDADRLESLGAIGLARVFYIGGMLKQALFDPEDPLAHHRPLDDMRNVLDHFQTKLLKLPSTMQTDSGKVLAQQQARYMIDYVGRLIAEINGNVGESDIQAIEELRTAFEC